MLVDFEKDESQMSVWYDEANEKELQDIENDKSGRTNHMYKSHERVKRWLQDIENDKDAERKFDYYDFYEETKNEIKEIIKGHYDAGEKAKKKIQGKR